MHLGWQLFDRRGVIEKSRFIILTVIVFQNDLLSGLFYLWPGLLI